MNEDIMSKSMVIYVITNRLNGKQYVGQTARPLGDRINEHSKSEYPIGHAIRKHGIENFSVEILAEGKTLDELCMLERYFIARFNSNDPNFGYNLTEGGEHIAGWHHTEQTRANISAALKGRIFTEAHKQHLREVNLGANNPMYGKHLTDEQKAKLSAALSGANNPLYGIPRSEEVKAKISATKLANGRSEEAIAKTKEACSIPIVCVETGIVYSSITEAAKELGVSRTAVAYVCHGKTKSIKGLTFRFVDPDRAQHISDRLNENRGSVNNVAVICIETGVIYESMLAAAESIGLQPANISSVCTGRSRTAGGYHWRRVTDEESNSRDRRCRAVRCIETGIVYESAVAAAASLELNLSSLYSVCNGKTQNVNGLHFEYVDSTGKRVMSDEERRNRLEATAVSVLCVEIGEEFEFKSNWRAVRCLTNGVVYQAVNMAAKALGLDSSSISKVCRGKLKATKGCVFEYVD